MASYTYDIAVSFAGEDRALAEALATAISSKDAKVFYDRFEAHKLWGKDLIEYLYNVYAKQAKYCVIFVSKNYVEKVWPKHERRSAQERALTEEYEYILPIRVDDSSLPGLPDTIGYIRLNDYTIDQITGLLLAKLGIETEQASPMAQPSQPELQRHKLVEVPLNLSTDTRYLRHQELSAKLMAFKSDKGYFALHSFSQPQINIPDDRIKETFLDTSRIYMASLTYASQPDIHSDGYTRRYQITVESNKGITTQATTCYYDGHIVTEGYIDSFLENDTGFNPMWFMYKIQRHLQLTKEVLESLVDTVKYAVILRNMNEFEWEVYRGHRISEKRPYVGYHRDIFADVQISEIHSRDRWNIKMQLVENIMVRIARMFGIDGLPQTYWNEKGEILYPLGLPGR